MIDTGPTPEAIDRELKSESDSALESLAGRLDPASQRRHWSALDTDQRKAIRAANELSRRRQLAERQSAEEARAQEREAYAAKLEAAIEEDYRAQMRRAFPGDDAAFSRLWPQLRDQWLLDRTRERMARDEQAVRERVYVRMR